MLILLSGAVIVFYAIAWPEAPLVTTDTQGYLRAATDLLDGHIDQLQDRPPGYPILLIATGSAGHPRRELFYFSLLLHVASTWLLTLSLLSLGVSRRLVVGFWVVALLPPFVQTAAWALTENLAEFCLASAFAALCRFFLTQRRSWLLVSSAALACLALTKPTFQLLAVALSIVIVGATWFDRARAARLKERVADGFVLATIPLVAVLGYSLLNFVRFHSFGLTPLFGLNLAVRTTNLYDYVEDRTLRQILVDGRTEAYLSGNETSWSVWHSEGALMRYTGKTEAELGRYLVPVCVRLIVSHPMAYLEQVARSFASFWFPAASHLPLFRSGGAKATWYILHFGVFGLFALVCAESVGLALRAVVLRSGNGPIPDSAALALLVALSIILYNAVLSCALDSGEVRQRTPTDILILSVVALGLSRLQRARNEGLVSGESGIGRPRADRAVSLAGC